MVDLFSSVDGIEFFRPVAVRQQEVNGRRVERPPSEFAYAQVCVGALQQVSVRPRIRSPRRTISPVTRQCQRHDMQHCAPLELLHLVDGARSARTSEIRWLTERCGS
jgi:hypothetical protein